MMPACMYDGGGGGGGGDDYDDDVTPLVDTVPLSIPSSKNKTNYQIVNNERMNKKTTQQIIISGTS